MSGAGNGGSAGGAPTNPKPSPAEVMMHFDMLPPIARAAVREANLDWDTLAIAKALSRGFSPDGLPAFIADFEAEHLARPE